MAETFYLLRRPLAPPNGEWRKHATGGDPVALVQMSDRLEGIERVRGAPIETQVVAASALRRPPR